MTVPHRLRAHTYFLTSTAIPKHERQLRQRNRGNRRSKLPTQFLDRHQDKAWRAAAELLISDFLLHVPTHGRRSISQRDAERAMYIGCSSILGLLVVDANELDVAGAN